MNPVRTVMKWRQVRACPKLHGRYWRRVIRRVVIGVWFGAGLEIHHLLYLRFWWLGDKGPLR